MGENDWECESKNRRRMKKKKIGEDLGLSSLGFNYNVGPLKSGKKKKKKKKKRGLFP